MDKLFLSLQGKSYTSHLLSLEDVENYVKSSVVLSQKGTKCIDGRYLPHQGHGMLSRPGADCGYVMVLEAVNRKKMLRLTSEECFTVVYKAIKKLNGAFYFHTEDAHGKDNKAIGCDHVACAARHGFSWEYDIRSKDAKEIVNYANHLSDVTMINLTGEHEEKGILIVCSEKYTVLADNPKRHQMFRVYDVDRDRLFMKRLVKEINIKGVTYEDMIREADLQFEATLQNLSVGLPLYKITFEEGNPRVSFIQVIEHKPLFKRMHLPPRDYFGFSRTSK